MKQYIVIYFDSLSLILGGLFLQRITSSKGAKSFRHVEKFSISKLVHLSAAMPACFTISSNLKQLIGILKLFRQPVKYIFLLSYKNIKESQKSKWIKKIKPSLYWTFFHFEIKMKNIEIWKQGVVFQKNCLDICDIYILDVWCIC